MPPGFKHKVKTARLPNGQKLSHDPDFFLVLRSMAKQSPVAGQIAAARKLLRSSQTELAKAAGVTRNTIRYWETMKAIPYGDDRTPIAIRWIEDTLTAAGVRKVIFPFAGVYLIPGKPGETTPHVCHGE